MQLKILETDNDDHSDDDDDYNDDDDDCDDNGMHTKKNKERASVHQC